MKKLIIAATLLTTVITGMASCKGGSTVDGATSENESKPQANTPVQNKIEKDIVSQNEAQKEEENQLIVQFWQQTKLRYDYQEIQGGVHEFLYETAQSISGNSYSQAKGRLENMENDKTLQVQVFYMTYVKFYNNKELMRMVLNSMCGSYSLANPISDYIFNKYSQNQQALQLIAENKQAEIDNQKFIEEKEKRLSEDQQKAEVKTTEQEAVSTTPVIFSYVEQMPEAGYDCQTYFANNLKYPDAAKANNIEGRVIVKFVVNEDGTFSNVHVDRGIGGGCDEEAIRLVNGMPKWKPGKQTGKPVKVLYTLPVVFEQK